MKKILTWTFALYGGLDSKSLTRSFSALAASNVGGILRESLNLWIGNVTFPAETVGGRPSAPTTDNWERHVLFK